MSSSKEILDPISAMCRLVALNFRPESTKVGVTDYAIEIQPPTTGQGIYRYTNGDDKDTISTLFPVVRHIIEWYLIPLYDAKNKKKKNTNKSTGPVHTKKEIDEVKVDKVDKIEIDETIQLNNVCEKLNFSNHISESEIYEYWQTMNKLSRYMCGGLSKLQETYKIGSIILTIQCLINLMIDAQEGRYSVNKLPKCMVDNVNLLDYNKIKDLWNYKKVHEVCELYDKCFEAQTDQLLSDKNKASKIEGYLKAVDHLLQISDDEFRKIIHTK
jgi:hypothetical protein